MTTFAAEFPRVGILNDYVHIPFANGSSFASQFLYREFSKRGSQVTVIGPEDPAIVPSELPRHVLLPSLPLRNHPGVRIPMPERGALRKLAMQEFSITVAQTCTGLMASGVWLRRTHGVPMVCVNTVHMPAVYDVMLPEALQQNKLAHSLFQNRIIPATEATTVDYYNGGDGLVVLSKGLKKYWQDLGVTVPIYVIPRSVDPNVFDKPAKRDPFPSWAVQGQRLLVVCRHTREKGVSRLLEIFAKHILPKYPRASLALVGDGPDHDAFKAQAKQLKVYDRCLWAGEVGLPDMPDWYNNADLFVYPSLSETYGQVVSEALWTGLPVVAFDDDKGVADQVTHDVDGFLVRPERDDSDQEFAARVDQLLSDRTLRRTFSLSGRANARDRSDPQRCVEAYQHVFRQARAHCERTWVPASTWERAQPLVKMAAWHSMCAVVGLLRQPAEVNRNGQKQPIWDRSDSVQEPSARRERTSHIPGPVASGVVTAA